MFQLIFPLIFYFLSSSYLLIIPDTGKLSGSDGIANSDSIEYQILYNGSIWRNSFVSVEGSQFLFAPDFIDGTLVIDKHTFNNIKIRYDIYSDELQILKNDGNIIQLNKDRISSFSINYNNVELKFKNMDSEYDGSLKGFWHLLSDSQIKIFVKYRKEILPTSYTNGPPKFKQTNTIYILKDNKITRTNKRKELLDLFTKEYKVKINKFIRNNDIVVSKTDPESFKRVIDYVETITR